MVEAKARGRKKITQIGLHVYAGVARETQVVKIIEASERRVMISATAQKESRGPPSSSLLAASQSCLRL